MPIADDITPCINFVYIVYFELIYSPFILASVVYCHSTKLIKMLIMFMCNFGFVKRCGEEHNYRGHG